MAASSSKDTKEDSGQEAPRRASVTWHAYGGDRKWVPLPLLTWAPELALWGAEPLGAQLGWRPLDLSLQAVCPRAAAGSLSSWMKKHGTRRRCKLNQEKVY